MNTNIAVVIPTRNEIDYLPRLVECLDRQTWDQFDIIVADNFSEDGTREYCRKTGLFMVNGGHPSAARNVGAKLASTDWVLFLDADILINDDFVERAVDRAQYHQAEVASFAFELITDELVIKLIEKLAVWYFVCTSVAGFSHGLGGALLVKKTAHESVNGFDESITVAGDQDYIHRLAKSHKYCFLTEPRVKVSARRFGKEGTLQLCYKYVLIELHRLLLGEIRHNRIRHF
jgi:glycosyltransferase involved in cell wall biosynthesis